MNNNKKKCELCLKEKARMYCESDEASVCWDCDSKVHSANFLVAKHTRNLLCHSCQNPTPWSASGPILSPTLSFCNSCLIHNHQFFRVERVEDNYQMNTTHDMDEYDDDMNDDDDDDDDDMDEYDDEDEDDDGNQVVPLSSSGLRESDCVHCEDEEECSSSLNCHSLLEEQKGTSSSIGFLRPMEVLRTNELCDQ